MVKSKGKKKTLGAMIIKQYLRCLDSLQRDYDDWLKEHIKMEVELARRPIKTWEERAGKDIKELGLTGVKTLEK